MQNTHLVGYHRVEGLENNKLIFRLAWLVYDPILEGEK